MPAPSLLVAFGTISTGGGNAINPTLTLMWQIPQISSGSGYRMSSVSSLWLHEEEQGHTIASTEREKSFPASFPLSQVASPGHTACGESLNHPQCHPAALQQPRKRCREKQLQESPGSQCQNGHPTSLPGSKPHALASLSAPVEQSW